MTLNLPEGWRGLAHFQLQTRRNVLKKSCHERTENELYVLENVAANVTFIRNLPFAKRLEVCKLLKYQFIEADTVVYKKGQPANSLYIIFTGSVKVVVGERSGKTIHLKRAGDHFGESVFVNDDKVRKDTATALEECEVLTLTKEDYESIIKTEVVTEELKKRIDILKNVRALEGISEKSIQRFAKLLSPRTFTKNKVIALQGEEAREMYFMISGECRVVMEVHKEPLNALRPPPLVAMKGYRGSVQDASRRSASSPPPMGGYLFKQAEETNILDSFRQRASSSHNESPSSRGKVHSSPSSRGSQGQMVTSTLMRGSEGQMVTSPLARGSQSQGQMVTSLLARGSQSQGQMVTSPLAQGSQGQMFPSTTRGSQIVTGPLARSRQGEMLARGSHGQMLANSPARGSHGQMLANSPARGSQRQMFANSPARRSQGQMLAISPARGSQGQMVASPPTRGSQGQMVASPPTRGSHLSPPRNSRLTPEPHAHLKDYPNYHHQDQNYEALTHTTLRTNHGTHHRKSIRTHTRHGNSNYTLSSFLKDFEKRECVEDPIPDLDFSDRDAYTWKTGTHLPGMYRGDVSDETFYQLRFEDWARKVLAKERKLPNTIIPNPPEPPPGTNLIVWHRKSSIPDVLQTKRKSNTEEVVLLDVGALHTGDFFGEIGLVHSRRKASILTVTGVEVYVLNKWDFNKQVDRDIIESLCAHQYKKSEEIYQQYQKSVRWAHYKKKVVQEVLAGRQKRFPNLYEHDMAKGIIYNYKKPNDKPQHR